MKSLNLHANKESGGWQVVICANTISCYLFESPLCVTQYLCVCGYKNLNINKANQLPRSISVYG